MRRNNTALEMSQLPATVKEATAAAKIAEISRRERLKAWSDYIGFVTAKASGFVAAGVGGYDLIFHTLNMGNNAASLASAGVAVLAGPKIAGLVVKILKAIE
jgi:hypothetical protein